MDKIAPEAFKAASALKVAVAETARRLGLTGHEAELLMVRSSQINGCAFCLDLHSRKAREAGMTQQKLDLLPAWRESTLFTEREAALLTVAECATRLPLDENTNAELAGARAVLGDEGFSAAEWVAVTINAFNRISILSQHPVQAQ